MTLPRAGWPGVRGHHTRVRHRVLVHPPPHAHTTSHVALLVVISSLSHATRQAKLATTIVVEPTELCLGLACTRALRRHTAPMTLLCGRAARCCRDAVVACSPLSPRAVGVSNKHRLVNLYLCALGPDGALKDTRFILVQAECPYV